MNEPYSPTISTEPTVQTDAFLPLVLIALSLIFVFIFQLTAITQQRAAFQSAIVNQDAGVKQSRQIQGNLEKLVRDLLEVAQTDSEAKSVVTKYGIQSNTTVAPLSVPAAPTK
ncbi:MAG: hypothetical protein QOD99_499 [Chthoniobacter sp.]|nr:hypothetical protein [Chthoniobacter sp.]